MRKTCLAGAIALALSGAQGALAEEAVPQAAAAAPEAPAVAVAPAAPAPEAPMAAAPAEPTAPAAAAPGPESLRAMTPAERREHFKQEHEKFRAAAEAAAPPPPPPLPEPPGMQGMAEPPDIAERTAAMEKLRSMTPEERRAAIKEAHMRMKEQIQAMTPDSPPASAAAEAAGPSGEMAQLKGMTPEDRSAFRAQRYQELRERAAALGLDLPESPPWEGHRRLTQEEIADYKARMRKITAEDREAYREEHYQKLRERARAAGLELPEAPPWKGPAGPAAPSHPSTAEIDRLHQEMVKLRTEMRDEIRNMYERLGAMSPEDRQAILDLYQPQIDEKWQQMARAMDQWQPSSPPPMGYGGEPPYGPGAGYGPAPYQGQGGPMPPYPPRDYGYGPGGGGYGPGGGGYGPGYGPGGGYGYGR